MKITIFAAGSHGDIQPCVVLGRGLHGAGYQVCLAAPQDFADFIQGNLDALPGCRAKLATLTVRGRHRQRREGRRTLLRPA